MPTFGLIAEGPTDHAVLENILCGFFGDPDLVVRPLQPLLDATDAARRQGGWTQVLAYCQSSNFQEAFGQNEYIVVQIDTDRLFEPPFSLNLKQSVEALVNQVVEYLEGAVQTALGKDFLDAYRKKILFAVAVNEIECWLLPLYYQDKKATATNNCLHKLNEKLGKTKERTINPGNKEPRRYEELSRPFSKKKTLSAAVEKNPSFKIFMDRLQEAFSGESSPDE